MIALLSPAKRLDFETPTAIDTHTQPRFLEQAAALAEQAAALKPAEIQSLMNVSEDIAEKTARRFSDFDPPFDLSNARQALFAFQGDVYQGLDAASLDTDGLEFAQNHIRILSGLYGLLRPLDLMQPYRLEMGTKFRNDRARDLYGFWNGEITDALNDALSDCPDPVVINLASKEYFKAVDRAALKAQVIDIGFKEKRDGDFRTVPFLAKKARGLMARFIIDNRIDTVRRLKEFNTENYRFRAELSSDDELVFTRPDSRKA